MIKNSILGKLCPVFHLRSAAVASLQNLNHWLVWSGTVPRCDSEEEHTLVGGWDMEEARRAVARGGGGALVWGQHCRKLYNYHKSLLHYRFFPLPQFLTSPIPTLVLCLFLCFFLYFKAVHLLLLICTPTLRSPWLSALYSSFSPWRCSLFEALLVTLTSLFSICLSFIYTVVCLHAFFIDLLFVA